MDTVASVCALTVSLAAAVGVFVRIFSSITAIRKGQQCLLRQQMLEVYYKCRESRTIRQYRYENFTMSYHAYKALGGNSFIDRIKREVDEWEVVT